jgi:hypothetical protein
MNQSGKKKMRNEMSRRDGPPSNTPERRLPDLSQLDADAFKAS